MHLEDLDFVALINQMWGSEDNLKSYCDSEVPRLCARICGPDAPVPALQITVPPLKTLERQGNSYTVASEKIGYKAELNGAPAKIYISVLAAGNKPKLPQFIAYALIYHWEALGAIGEETYDYPEPAETMIRDICMEMGMSDAEYKDAHSPKFIAKAMKVAQDFELPLRDFLFPKLSLTVYMPRAEEGQGESN
jgi:hypothetical protein